MLRALKVARPWEWKKLQGMEGWQQHRQDYMNERSDQLWREYTLLTKAEHPNIVGCYAFGLVQLSQYQDMLPALLLEHCPGGSLDSRLPATLFRQQQPPDFDPRDQPPMGLPADIAQGYMRTVCSVLRHLHSKCIAHRDLKAENVFIGSQDGQEVVKLGDLGHAWDFSLSGTPTDQRAYTLPFRPPEMSQHGLYNCPRTDSWLAGSFLLQLRGGWLPWWYLLEGQEQRRCAAELDNPRSPYHALLGLEEKALIKDCLADYAVRQPLRVIMERHKNYFGTS